MENKDPQSTRLTELEVQNAHLTRLLEELNDVVVTQAKSITLLERRVTMLMRRASEQEAENTGGVFVSDQKPPHY